jgi:hypothetical protein
MKVSFRLEMQRKKSITAVPMARDRIELANVKLQKDDMYIT